MKRAWLGIEVLLLSLVMSATLGAQTPSFTPPQGVSYVTTVEGISEYRLDNGLRVLLFPDQTQANITVNITYMVGSRHEGYGETGMAHLLEHLLFKGSKNHPDVKKELQDHGASPNGTTSFDRTNYYETFQASDENLEWALSLEADRMVNSFIAKKDLDSEMTVVRNEFESGENSPLNVLQERVMSTGFLWHNYGNTVIGARSDIEQVPIENLQAFYRHFYQPDNATLVVAGKIDPAKTLALINKYFAPLPKPERQLRRTYTIEPAQDGERSVTLRRVGDIQATMVMYHTPAATSDDIAAVDLAAMIMSDQPSGRLYKALVEPGKAVQVAAGAQVLRDPGFTMFIAILRKEQSLDDATAIMLETIDNIKSQPFTEEELARMKTQYAASFVRLLNNSQSAALQLSNWESMGDWRLLFLYRDRVQAVTLQQVQQAAEKYFIASNRTIGKFIPEAQEPPRVEIPAAPDAATLVANYKGTQQVEMGEAFDATPENIDQRTIFTASPGGIKLSLLSKKTRGGQVSVRMSLRFGDASALKGYATAAGLVGDMMMLGTKKHTRQQIQDELARLKTSVGIGGSPGGVIVTMQTLRENLPAALDLVVEMLREPAFPQKEFDELKPLLLASLENSKNEPTSIASRAMNHFLNSHYAQDDPRYSPTLDEQMTRYQALTLADIKGFYEKFYGASDGFITVIGDFDVDAVKAQLSGLLDSWKSPQKYERMVDPYVKLTPTTETFETPDKANSMWLAVQPFALTDTDPDYAAMTLSSYIFGSSGMNSRLFQRIRDKEGLSYGVGGQFSIPTGGRSGDNASLLYVYAISAPQNTPKVETVFKEELTRLLADGFTAEEVEAAKKSWAQEQKMTFAQDASLVTILNTMRYWNRTMAFYADLEKRIMALTPQQMLEALRRHIDPSRISFFRAGDFKKAGVAW